MPRFSEASEVLGLQGDFPVLVCRTRVTQISVCMSEYSDIITEKDLNDDQITQYLHNARELSYLLDSGVLIYAHSKFT